MASVFTASTAQELDQAIQTVNSSSTLGPSGNYEIDLSSSITLDRQLTTIAIAAGHTLVINGASPTPGQPNYTLNGDGAFNGFFVGTGAVTIANLAISDAVASGGDTTGGGGAGLGGGVFVGFGSTVTLSNVAFANDAAKGGAGGDIAADNPRGGGLGGTHGGEGGGGASSNLSDSQGGNGGPGGFGGGGGNPYGTASQIVGVGGAGGFGGGGGGGGSIVISNSSAIAQGGFGGGQGGLGSGGGGLGAGADVFVQQGGSLVIGAGSLGAGTVTGGTSGVTPGAAFGNGLFIQGTQTVVLSPGAGQSLVIAGDIADENGSQSSLAAGQGTSNGDGTTGGAGALAVQSGIVTLSGNNTYAGGTTLSGGEIVAGSEMALGQGALAMASGTTLGFSGSLTVRANITLTDAEAALFDVAEGQTDTLTGTIADNNANDGPAGILEKTGAGTLVLSGQSNYLGGTVIAGGTLQYAGSTPSLGFGVTFAGTATSTATLVVPLSAQPPRTVVGVLRTLNDFGADDTLVLQGHTFSASDSLTLSGDTLTFTDAATNRVESFNLGGTHAGAFFLHDAGANGVSIDAVCYCGGTRIRTCRGEVPVEELRIGDVAVTSSGAQRPIRWIGSRTVKCRRHPRPYDVMPIRIAAHAFGEGRPVRDLRVSPGHAICVDVVGEVLIPAIALVNGSTITRDEVEAVTYWHVELDSHDILLAENLPAESYLDTGNRGFFTEADVAELGAGPDADATDADFCRPFHDDGPLVEAVRMQLRRRAVARGWRRDAGDGLAGPASPRWIAPRDLKESTATHDTRAA